MSIPIVSRIFPFIYCARSSLSFVVFFIASFFSPSFAVTVLMECLHTSSPFASLSSCNGSPYSLQSISKYGKCLEAHRFGAMRIVGEQASIDDLRFEEYCDTSVGAWINCWCHCGVRRASSSRSTHESPGLSFAGVSKRLPMSAGSVSL